MSDFDIPKTDPFDNVAYSDIVEGSVYYEEEVRQIIRQNWSQLYFI